MYIYSVTIIINIIINITTNTTTTTTTTTTGENARDQEEWRKYPLTPRSKHDLSITLRHIEQQFNDDEEASIATAVKERKSQEEAHLQMLARDKTQRDTFTKGAASYYSQVCVGVVLL